MNILGKQALSGSNILADPLIYQGSCHPERVAGLLGAAQPFMLVRRPY
jgi:hypothetical protein